MTTEDLVREATVDASFDDALELAASLQVNLSAVVLGTPGAVVAATTAVLAAGNLLIEDVPGVGKTMLAKAIAVSIGTRGWRASRATPTCCRRTSPASRSTRHPRMPGSSGPVRSLLTSCCSTS